ncbi:unnamed protein product [Victoria cruziana]
MLLRSSSSPILNSWVAALARDPLPSDVAIDAVRPLRHSRSVTHLSSLPHLSASSSQSSAAHFRFDGFRPRNAGKLSDLSWSDVEEAGEEDASVAESHSVNRFLSCSGLDEDPEAEGVLSPEEAEELWNEYCSLEADGAEGGEDGEGDWLKKCGEDDGAVDVNSAGSGFGKNDGSGGFCSGEGENSSDLDSVATDAMYRQMIEADPSNSLLLRNYAEFLHEVEGDLDRAEEYYGRALVADPFDGDVLSRYATLLWKERGDYKLADTFFSRAIEASPGNCFIIGSYASFLWELGETEEGERYSEGSSSWAHSDSARLEEGAASMPIAASG